MERQREHQKVREPLPAINEQTNRIGKVISINRLHTGVVGVVDKNQCSQKGDGVIHLEQTDDSFTDVSEELLEMVFFQAYGR